MNNNVINRGYIAIDKDFIFFRNSSDNNRLYRIDRERNIIKISDKSVRRIVISEDWVYFSKDDATTINRVQFDGSLEEELYEGVYMEIFEIRDNHILFGNCEDLVRMNLLTRKAEEFHFYKRSNHGEGPSSGPINDVFFKDSYLYFLDDFRKVCRVPSSDLNQSFHINYLKLLEANNVTVEKLIDGLKQANYDIKSINDVEDYLKLTGAVHMPIVYDETNIIQNIDEAIGMLMHKNFIYYIKNESSDNVCWDDFPEPYVPYGKLYRIDLDNNASIRVLNNNITSVYIGDEFIAFIDRDNNYRLTIKTSERNKVIDIDNIVDLNASGDTIYFYDVTSSLYELEVTTFKINKITT